MFRPVHFVCLMPKVDLPVGSEWHHCTSSTELTAADYYGYGGAY